MSPINTPRSSGTAPPTSNHSDTLTPSQKVRALLAQFSDSDSEEEQNLQAPNPPRDAISQPKSAIQSDESEDDSDSVVLRNSRLATRLQGQRGGSTDDGNAVLVPELPASSEPRSNVLTKEIPESYVSSEDEITTHRPVRQRSRAQDSITPPRNTKATSQQGRSASPLFFPSPSNASNANIHHSPAKEPSSDGRSRFLALVDKHRKERLAREAAEVAKRAVGLIDTEKAGGRARGSSPADDSSEESDTQDKDAVKRIQKQARPTRKASKKALEEMNRETQRMSRNMQLAHQAKTKTKITKESLLARFNFLSSVEKPIQPNSSQGAAPRPTSSSSNSDAESEKGHHTTPPTSPLRDVEDNCKESVDSRSKDLTSLLDGGQLNTEMHGAIASDDDLPGLETLLDAPAVDSCKTKLYEYQLNDRTVQSPDSTTKIGGLKADTKNSAKAKQNIRHFRALVQPKAATLQDGSESDDDIDIIRDRGLKRKYAAFETLPRRKAKEKPSHLALRSLAHIGGSNDKKNSTSAAEMTVDLRRKARFQAIEERKQKIEELKAKGIVIQSIEERERDQQEVEDLVERARQEAAEIQRREKETAKKQGTYVRDNLEDDEDDDDSDANFEEDLEGSIGSESDEDVEGDDIQDGSQNDTDALVDAEVEEQQSVQHSDENEEENNDEPFQPRNRPTTNADGSARPARRSRIVSDDEDDLDTPKKTSPSSFLPQVAKTPLSVPRSARKVIPGLQMSDDLPMDLSQAFAATMAESQAESILVSQGQISPALTADLPSLRPATIPPLQRLDSIELISDSQPSASQSLPYNANVLPQSQLVPESPRALGISAPQYTPSQKQLPFDLTQDNGYILSPFIGNRFAETPLIDPPHSTVETVILPNGLEDSPIVQRKGRLQRGKANPDGDDESGVNEAVDAFKIMQQRTKPKSEEPKFDKKKSNARNIVDDAAEESEDEYAGLGGASDDSGDDEENEDDRGMIDEDTQVGKGDEATLAGLYADRERERDEKEVSKLLKDITTGALRRKRGVGDDLDLSDEEDAVARRREAKRREFAKMRRELLKDEAVGKIADDKKKEAFLRSIEDREIDDEDNEDFDQDDSQGGLENQTDTPKSDVLVDDTQRTPQTQEPDLVPLQETSKTKLNRQPAISRRGVAPLARRPATLAEIRESVSFLVEEPHSQAAVADLGLSDSEDEPEAYVNLDRHFREAELDENQQDGDEEDLGDFVVDDETADKHATPQDVFKKPELPRQERAPFSERRTKRDEVVDRLSLLRQASSSASSTSSTVSNSTKMAFKTSATSHGSFSGVPSLLRRATTNSSLGSMSGRDNVSATGVVTSKTERGNAGDEKEFVRKGSSGRRNAVNYQAERKTLREEKMSARAGVKKAVPTKKKNAFLNGLFRGDSWE